MAKITPKPVPKKPTPQILLQEFLSDNKIELEYSVVEDRFINVGDGFILAPKNPMLKVIAKYVK